MVKKLSERKISKISQGTETSDGAGVRLKRIFAAGKPLKEAIAWQSPLVMNTQEELKTAFRELREDTFIK